MSMYHVYELKNPMDGVVFYIGKGNSRRSRFKDHIRQAERLSEGKSVKNRILAGIIRRIIENGFLPLSSILVESEDEQLILVIESELIAKLGRMNLGTGVLANLTDGAEGTCGLKHSDESRAAIGRSSRGRRMSESAREKIKISATGRTHSEATKKKISLAGKGRETSEYTKSLMSISSRRLKHTDATKKKISENMMGDKNHRFGLSIPLSEEHKAAIKRSWGRRKERDESKFAPK